VFTHLPQDVLADLQPFLDRQESAATAKESKHQESWKMLKLGVVGVGSRDSMTGWPAE
jgi:hypothetical protein